MPTGAEQWRSIPGFDGYDASDLGGVRSWWICGSNPRRKAAEPRRLKPSAQRGYLGVGLVTDNGVRLRRSVHCVVLEAFVGPCPAGMQCRHLSGDRGDNRLPNIVWGTPKENSADKVAHGTVVSGDAHYSRREPHRLARGDRAGMRLHPGSIRRGSANGNSKQREGNVRVIKMLLSLQDDQRPTMKEIGRAMRIDGSTVSDIKTGRIWRHV